MLCITRNERDGEPAENIIVNHLGFILNYLRISDIRIIQNAIDNTLALYDEMGINTDEGIDELNQYEDEIFFNNRLKEVDSFKPQKTEKCDHLYIISDTDNNSFKVGRSINPEARLRAMRTASSHNLVLDIYYEGCGDKEAELHELLKDYRLHGEWFSDNETTRGIIDDFMDGQTYIMPYGE